MQPDKPDNVSEARHAQNASVAHAKIVKEVKAEFAEDPRRHTGDQVMWAIKKKWAEFCGLLFDAEANPQPPWPGGDQIPPTKLGPEERITLSGPPAETEKKTLTAPAAENQVEDAPEEKSPSKSKRGKAGRFA